MELSELFSLIKEELILAGFTKRYSCMPEDYRSSWTVGNEAVDELYESPEGINYTRLTGRTLDVEKVCTHNSVQNSVSYYLRFMKWDKSTGHAEYTIKINSKQTEKTLRNKVRDFILQYKNINKYIKKTL